MKSVGIQIREARQCAGLALEQISANTCIPLKIVQALEEDDLRQITSAFFYKSFVKQFCAQVGLPFDHVREAVEAASSIFPDPLMPGQGEALIRSTVIRRPRRSKHFRWLFPALSFLLVMIACSGIYAYWEKIHLGSAHLPFEALLRGAPGSLSILGHSDTSAAIALPRAEVPPEPDGRFHVKLSAVERSWLSIEADGKQVYAGTLEVDETKVLEGSQEGELRTKNAGGVKIVFNGKPIGLAGPRGSVRTVLFTRDNYEVVKGPVHAAVLFIPRVIGEWLTPPPVR